MRTRLGLHGTAYGQLHGQDGVAISVADAIAPAIERADIVLGRHPTGEVARGRSPSGHLVRRIRIERSARRRHVACCAGMTADLAARRRIVLGLVILLLLVLLMLVLLRMLRLLGGLIARGASVGWRKGMLLGYQGRQSGLIDLQVQRSYVVAVVVAADSHPSPVELARCQRPDPWSMQRGSSLTRIITPLRRLSWHDCDANTNKYGMICSGRTSGKNLYLSGVESKMKRGHRCRICNRHCRVAGYRTTSIT